MPVVLYYDEFAVDLLWFSVAIYLLLGAAFGLASGFGPFLADFVLIAYDTSHGVEHNLFPLELAMALLFGLGPATIGALTARFFRRDVRMRAAWAAALVCVVGLAYGWEVRRDRESHVAQITKGLSSALQSANLRSCEGSTLPGFENEEWSPSTYRRGDARDQFAAYRHIFRLDCSNRSVIVTPIKTGLR